MTEHEEHADRLERELDDLEEQGDRVEEHIGDARSDWESKKADDSVPGAAGEPSEVEDEPPPEQQYPAKGD